MGTILLYGYDDLPSILAIGAAVSSFGAEVLPVHSVDYLKPVGALIGRDVSGGTGRAYAGGILGNHLIIFCDLDEIVSELLTALAQAGITREVYKAVLTVHNQAWDVLTLMEELKRERQLLQGRK